MHVPPVPEQQEIACIYHSACIELQGGEKPAQSVPLRLLPLGLRSSALQNPRFNASMLMAPPTTVLTAVFRLTQPTFILNAAIAQM